MSLWTNSLGVAVTGNEGVESSDRQDVGEQNTKNNEGLVSERYLNVEPAHLEDGYRHGMAVFESGRVKEVGS